MKPPHAAREEVMEELHGHRIADPFRWLENAESPQTRAFVEAQNAYTEAVLSAIPTLNPLSQRSPGRLGPGSRAARYAPANAATKG